MLHTPSSYSLKDHASGHALELKVKGKENFRQRRTKQPKRVPLYTHHTLSTLLTQDATCCQLQRRFRHCALHLRQSLWQRLDHMAVTGYQLPQVVNSSFKVLVLALVFCFAWGFFWGGLKFWNIIHSHF